MSFKSSSSLSSSSSSSSSVSSSSSSSLSSPFSSLIKFDSLYDLYYDLGICFPNTIQWMNLVGLISQGNYRFIVRILPSKVSFHVMEQDLCIDEEFEWSYDDLAETSNNSLSLTRNMHSGQYVFSGTDVEWIQVIKNLYKYYETCTNFVLGRSFSFENQAKVNFSYDQVIEKLLLKKYNNFKDDDDDYSEDGDEEEEEDNNESIEEEEEPKSKGKEILMEIFKAFLTGYRKKKEESDNDKGEDDSEDESDNGDDSGSEKDDSGSEKDESGSDKDDSGSDNGDESGSDKDDSGSENDVDKEEDPSKWNWSRTKAIDRIYEYIEKYVPSWISTIPSLSGQQDIFANSTKVLIGKMSDEDLLLLEMSILDNKIGLKEIISLIKGKLNCSPELKSFLDLLV